MQRTIYATRESPCTATKQALADLLARGSASSQVPAIRMPLSSLMLLSRVEARPARQAIVKSLPVSMRSLAQRPKFVMNGSRVTVPLGVTQQLTVSALKALAGEDSNAVVFIRRRDGDLRLEDSDIVEIRDGVEQCFTAAVPWTTLS